MAALWDDFLGFLSNFITPDWGSLVAVLPLGLAAIVALFLLFVVLSFALAGPTRRGRRRLRPLPPPGVHAPSPSIAPLLVAAGVAILFFGVVVRGPLLAVGLVATILALLFWGREEMQAFRRLEAGGAGHGDHGNENMALAEYDAAGLRPLETLAGPPLPRLRPPQPAPDVERAAGVHLPEPSFRPLLVSLSAAVVFFGVVLGPVILAAGVLMLVITLLGWLADARAEYRATVAADRTGHLEHRSAPRAPIGTLALFALVIVVAAGFRSGFLPPNIPPVPTPAVPSAAGGGAAQASAGASATPVAPGSSASGPANGGQGAASTLKVSAQGIKFNVQSLTAPANTGFTIEFNNQDSGIPHDIVIHKDGPTGQAVFEGTAFPGPATKTYSVSALPAGTYTFICSIHPQSMQGTLTVH